MRVGPLAADPFMRPFCFQVEAHKMVIASHIAIASLYTYTSLSIHSNYINSLQFTDFGKL